MRKKPHCLYMPVLLVLFSTVAAAEDISFTSEQVDNGLMIYQEHCQMCHGTSLMNGQFGPPLRGSFFQKKWSGLSVGALLQLTIVTMPPDNKEGLPKEAYAQVIAYLLSRNKLETGDKELPGEPQQLLQMLLPW